MFFALHYLKKYWQSYLSGFAILLVVNLLSASIPQLIKIAINLLAKQEVVIQIGTWMAKLNYVIPLASITNLTLMVLSLAAVMALLRIASRWIIFGLGRQVEFDLKKDIFNHLVVMEPAFFSKNKTGDLISIITNDVQSFRALAGFAMLNVANTICAFAMIIPLMYQLNSKLTLCFVALIPLILIVVTLISDKIKLYQEEVQEKLGAMSHFLEQNLSAIHLIKSYAMEKSETKRFAEQNQSLLSSYLNLVKARSFIGPSMKMIASFGFILLLYVGGKSAIAGDFDLGSFAAYALYIERLIWPVATMGWLVTVFQRAEVSAVRIRSLLDQEPKIKDSSRSIGKNTFETEIDLVKLNARISKGQMIGVVGTIGSGKTVLAKKLMHLVELEDGEMLIDGVDVQNIKLRSLRQLVNMVPQDTFMFSTSVRDNILYGHCEQSEVSSQDLELLMQQACVYDDVQNFPLKEATIVGEKGVTLSGGQRQRIAIARALAIDPEILILDDALSSVDEKTACKIIANLHKLRKAKTTIFITHKVSVVEDMDHILVMDELQIVEQGKHAELMQQDGLYKKLVGIDLQNKKVACREQR